MRIDPFGVFARSVASPEISPAPAPETNSKAQAASLNGQRGCRMTWSATECGKSLCQPTTILGSEG